MTHRIRWPGALGALWLLLVSVPLSTWGAISTPATVRVPVHLGPTSALWLEGTSNVHHFESRTTEPVVTIARNAAANGNDLAVLLRGSNIPAVDVLVPVRSLHSPRSGIDKNLWKALKSEEFKNITFHLDRYTLPARGAVGDTLTLQAEGSLTIAGHERPTKLDARMYPGTGGMWLEGSHTLKMTEFGIKPPTMMLGTLRVGDQITIRYRLLLVAGEATASTSN